MAEPQTLKIRQATTADVDKISSIERECYNSSAYSNVILRQLVDIAPNLFLVAETSSVIGFVAGQMSSAVPRSGWILSLLVSPCYRRQGFGSSLAKQLVLKLYELGATSISLTVAPSKSDAQKLYTDLGFSLKRCELNYFGPGEDRLVYEKQLMPLHRSHLNRFLTQTTERDFDKVTELIHSRVQHYYWKDNLNCTTVVLKNLSETFNISLDQQICDAALGMHGAGGYRAQCGLVEGALLFFGILGRKLNIADDKTVELCRCFARSFEHEFTSLLCRELRPEGFAVDNPPHLCQQLTIQAHLFIISFLRDKLSSELIDRRDS